MPSFDIVNYSLRPNKSIQRSLIFEGVGLLQEKLSYSKLIYVGLGSVWFSDFQMAHKLLRVQEMVSIEEDVIGYRRAKFNRPYRTVTVEKGNTSQVLPKMYKNARYSNRPWLIWLDYDKALDKPKIEDIRGVIENAPSNSIALATFPATGYGKPAHRPLQLRTLLGNVVPDDLSRDDCSDEKLSETLGTYCTQFMTSVAASASRPGGFVPAFQIGYRDSRPMVTVGGVLPSTRTASAVRSIVSSPRWPGLVREPIAIGPLTLKEAAAMQAELPRKGRLTRKVVRDLGFDLESDFIRAFEKYYRHYPIFAQVVT